MKYEYEKTHEIGGSKYLVLITKNKYYNVAAFEVEDNPRHANEKNIFDRFDIISVIPEKSYRSLSEATRDINAHIKNYA